MKLLILTPFALWVYLHSAAVQIFMEPTLEGGKQMNWANLQEKLDSRYGFLKKTKFNETQLKSESELHPLLYMSTCLASGALTSGESSRLIILLPRKLDCALRISSLCALIFMKSDYTKNVLPSLDFTPGQRLQLNGCIVEYVNKGYLEQYGLPVVNVRCRNGVYGFKLDRHYQLQPTLSTRPLATMERVSRAYLNSVSEICTVDMLLGIRTLGNRMFFDSNVVYVSGTGNTEKAIKNISINGTKLADLMLWGKLNPEGDVSIISPGALDAKPNCVVAGDLMRLQGYLEDNVNTVRGVVLDGTSLLNNNLQILDDEILARSIPAVVVCDYSDTPHIQPLIERGFKVWQWSRENIHDSGCLFMPETGRQSGRIPAMLENYYSFELINKICAFPELERVFGLLERLDRETRTSDETIKRLCGRLFGILLGVSRLIRVPEVSWVINFEDKINQTIESFSIYRLWLTEEARSCLDDISGLVAEVSAVVRDGSSGKVKAFSGIYTGLSNNDTLFIVPNEDELAKTEDYCKGMLMRRGQHLDCFADPSDINDTLLDRYPKYIVVCGWLGRENMYKILHSFTARKIEIFLYPFEDRWFRQSDSSWRSQNTFKQLSDDFIGILSDRKEDIAFLGNAIDSGEKEVVTQADDIFDFELRSNKYRYSRFGPQPGERDEAVRTRLIRFSQNKFAFITETHSLYVVTDILTGGQERSEIPRKRVDNLRIGDFILFMDSDRDIIREIADQGLTDDGLIGLRKDAGLWQEALQEKLAEMNGDIRRLYQALANKGCKRHIYTVRNWLYSEDIIGPRFLGDLGVISALLPEKFPIDKVKEVERAISAVRSAHMQASAYIQNKVLARLPDIVSVSNSAESFKRSLTVDLDDFGQITILKIESISDEWMNTGSNWVNRLLTQEGDDI